MKKSKSTRVKVERGYGPRHAMNAQEGSEAVPDYLPTPPEVPDTRGDAVRKWLFEQVQEGVLPKESVEEIMRDPKSLASLAAYASAGIALSSGRGKGGKSIYPPLAKEAGAIPGKTWASWKPVTPADAPGPEIRVDPAGNYFQETGSHHSMNPLRPPEQQTYHVIAKPVELDALKLPSAEKPPSEEPPSVKLTEKGQGDISKQLDEYHNEWWGDWEKALGKRRPPDWNQKEPPEWPGGYRKGTKKVGVSKGFGPRHAENAKEGDLTAVNTDTVPAMLTPREAVLNRNAAELAGRGNIEKLNARGNKLAEKGVDLASGGGKTMKEKAKKYQGGDEAVPGKRKPQGSQNTNQYGVAFGWNPPGPTGPPEQVPGYGTVPGPGDAQGTQNVNRWGVPYGWNPGAFVPGAGQGNTPGYDGSPIPMPLPSPVLPPGGMQGGPQPVKRIPSNNLYPPGQGMQYGESAVGAGGGGTIYGNAAPVQLSAPGGLAELVAAIKAEAKKQGLSAEQMKGLMSTFSSFGGGGGGFSSDASVAASAPDASAYGLRGYQGGISEIGYPPFVGPNMQYHTDKGGGWEGRYDPAYMIPVYQRGTSSVRGSPSFGKPGSIPGKNVNAPGFQGGEGDIEPPALSQNENRWPFWIGDYPSRWEDPYSSSQWRPGDISGWRDEAPTGGGGLDLENRLGWDPSRPTYGFGSGKPTQRGIGTAAEIVGNAMFPGAGLLTGPLARMITRMVQRMIERGASREEIKTAVTQAQGSSGGGGGGGGGKFDFKWPQGMGGFGKPMGYFNIPNYMGRGDFGAPSTIPGSPSGQGTIANTGITFNDVLASGVPMRGRTSVGAPAGGYSPMGTFGPTNLHSRFQPAGMGRGWNQMFGTWPGGDLSGAGGGPHWNIRKT